MPTQATPWTRRLSTRLVIIAVVLVGVSGLVGAANLWAFQTLEHDAALEILGCGTEGGNGCRELGRAHLQRLHVLQYLFLGLSVAAYGLVVWLAGEVRVQIRDLTALSERLARGETFEEAKGPRSELAEVGRSFGS